tara:strand:- start:426 stop:842 length:417 start_codon:yes stop_codon:yes gene_type:complete
MDIKVSVNFDFGKLANQMDKIIGDYTSGYAKDTVQGTRNNIDRGIGADGAKLKLGEKSYRAGQQALYNTGDMYNSLKSKGNTLTINKYGYGHHKQDFSIVKPPVKGTNVKNFIGTTKDSKQKLDKKFMESVKKALLSK